MSYKSAYKGHLRRSRKTFGRKRLYHLTCMKNVRFKQRKLNKREKKNIWDSVH